MRASIESSKVESSKVESSKDITSAEKAVQASPLHSPMNKTITTLPPVLIQHQGLEMKRIEMRQSCKAVPTTTSVLQQTTTLDNISDDNIHTSNTVPSASDSVTVNSGSCDEATHTTTVISDQHATTVITDQEDVSSHVHTSAGNADQEDILLHKHISTGNGDQDDALLHKQKFLNVMDIEGELVENIKPNSHKEETSNSSTSGSV